MHRGVGEQPQLDGGSIVDVQYQPAEQEAAVLVPLPETRKRKKALNYPDDERGVLAPEPQAQKRRRPQQVPDALSQEQGDPVVLQPPQSLQQKVDTLTRELRICQEKIKRLEQTVEQMARAQQVQRHIPLT